MILHFARERVFRLLTQTQSGAWLAVDSAIYLTASDPAAPQLELDIYQVYAQGFSQPELQANPQIQSQILEAFGEACVREFLSLKLLAAWLDAPPLPGSDPTILQVKVQPDHLDFL